MRATSILQVVLALLQLVGEILDEASQRCILFRVLRQVEQLLVGGLPARFDLVRDMMRYCVDRCRHFPLALALPLGLVSAISLYVEDVQASLNHKLFVDRELLCQVLHIELPRVEPPQPIVQMRVHLLKYVWSAALDSFFDLFSFGLERIILLHCILEASFVQEVK